MARVGSGGARCVGLAAAVVVTLSVQVSGRAADSAPTPNANEQYAIEVLNRTRADPAKEAQRFQIDLNEGLDPGTLSPEPREPLAVNFELIAAARLHNQDLFNNFSQLPPTHVGSNGLDPTGRASAAGASFLGGVAENNAWSSQSSTAVTAASVNANHTLLFKDFTATFEIKGRGHRKVMLNGTRDEVGVAVSGGMFGGKTAAIMTQDFVTTDRLHLLGVVYVDNVLRDRFYTPGEGMGRVAIEAVRQGDGATFRTETWGSGGWQVIVPPGTYDVTALGGGLPAAQTATGLVVTDANVKRDFVTDRVIPVPKAPACSLAVGNATKNKAGAWALAVPTATVLLGTFTITPDEASQVSVAVDGTTYFAPADRAASKVVTKLDATTGAVRKITVRDAAGNSFSLDVKTGVFKLTLKSAPGFDPTDGTVSLRVLTPRGAAVLDVPATPLGKSGKRMRLARTTGSIATS